MKNKMTPGEALFYGKHAAGCVSINQPPYEGRHRTEETISDDNHVATLYNRLVAEGDPGMHHEREFNEFYDRLGNSGARVG